MATVIDLIGKGNGKEKGQLQGQMYREAVTKQDVLNILEEPHIPWRLSMFIIYMETGFIYTGR